jgi:hypothetical protein
MGAGREARWAGDAVGGVAGRKLMRVWEFNTAGGDAWVDEQSVGVGWNYATLKGVKRVVLNKLR